MPPLQNQLIDLQKIIDSCTEKWSNQILTQVNDSVVRLGVIEGEYHWHRHEREDEFFLVLDGRLILELENQAFVLSPMQGFTVPKGVLHRTRAEERTAILMMERASAVPQGD